MENRQENEFNWVKRMFIGLAISSLRLHNFVTFTFMYDQGIRICAFIFCVLSKDFSNAVLESIILTVVVMLQIKIDRGILRMPFTKSNRNFAIFYAILRILTFIQMKNSALYKIVEKNFSEQKIVSEEKGFYLLYACLGYLFYLSLPFVVAVDALVKIGGNYDYYSAVEDEEYFETQRDETVETEEDEEEEEKKKELEKAQQMKIENVEGYEI
jgi:hypothetical protein